MNHTATKGKKWQDAYSRQAKKDKYPARSVYKLQEIQKKHHLIKKGYKVLDLGCCPGSWLLYAARQTGSSGKVVGIDLNPVSIQVPSHVQVLTADVLDLDAGTLDKAFDVVLSDMAPATTGNKIVDTARSISLCESALYIAKTVLVPGGSFVCKVFQGSDFNSFSEEVRMVFETRKIFKPRSSRKASKEIFIIGLGFKGN
ncbi:MAG: RlmE family RNA methyltransferase [Desulfobacterales bacterium]|jgi:23S rRNA (uridine2552-2'-O)-methyltransferase